MDPEFTDPLVEYWNHSGASLDIYENFLLDLPGFEHDVFSVSNVDKDFFGNLCTIEMCIFYFYNSALTVTLGIPKKIDTECELLSRKQKIAQASLFSIIFQCLVSLRVLTLNGFDGPTLTISRMLMESLEASVLALIDDNAATDFVGEGQTKSSFWHKHVRGDRAMSKILKALRSKDMNNFAEEIRIWRSENRWKLNEAVHSSHMLGVLALFPGIGENEAFEIGENVLFGEPTPIGQNNLRFFAYYCTIIQSLYKLFGDQYEAFREHVVYDLMQKDDEARDFFTSSNRMTKCALESALLLQIFHKRRNDA